MSGTCRPHTLEAEGPWTVGPVQVPSWVLTWRYHQAAHGVLTDEPLATHFWSPRRSLRGYPGLARFPYTICLLSSFLRWTLLTSTLCARAPLPSETHALRSFLSSRPQGLPSTPSQLTGKSVFPLLLANRNSLSIHICAISRATEALSVHSPVRTADLRCYGGNHIRSSLEVSWGPRRFRVWLLKVWSLDHSSITVSPHWPRLASHPLHQKLPFHKPSRWLMGTWMFE